MDKHVPPNNIEAESAILGTMLLDGDSVSSVIDRISPDDFYQPGNQKIFSAIGNLFSGGKPIDLLTVTENLLETGELDKIGGPAYIASLTDDTIPQKSRLREHTRIIAEKAKKRQLIAFMRKFADRCYTDPLEHIVEDFSRDFFRMTSDNRKGPVPISDGIENLLENLSARMEGDKKFPGLPTGFYELDGILNGLQPSDLIILGARPAMGKTALAMNIALNCSRNGTKVLVFSLEMSKEQLAERLLSTMTGINGEAIRRGMLSDDQLKRLTSASKALSRSSIHLDDSPALTVQGIRARAYKLASQGNLDLIIVDYLQLMNGAGESRERQVAEMSAGLKAIAKTLNVPVLALSQLNRSLESRTDKRPKLSDLRDSGSIEQDADVVMFLYRDEVYSPRGDNPTAGIAELHIAKHRNGRTGEVRLGFEGHVYRFNNLGH